MKNIFKYFIKHAKFYRAIEFCVLIFMMSSCGIPTALYLSNSENDESSYYEFSSEKISDLSYTTTLKLNIRDTEKQVNNTPSICYFYAIYPENSDISESVFSNAITNEFNDEYYNKYPGKRLNISNDDPYVLNITKNDNNIKLYKFSYNDEDQLPLAYLATMKSFIYNNDYEILLSIDYDETNKIITFNESTSSNVLQSNINSSFVDSSNLKLKRYISKNESFIDSNIDNTDKDYLYVNDIDEINLNSNFKILVFAAISIEGTNFSNIFWSELHPVGSLSL